jgi:hypothetical protein
MKPSIATPSERLPARIARGLATRMHLALWLLVVAATYAGCRTTPDDAGARSDAGEYRRVTGHFIKAVDETLRLLDRATAPTARNPRSAILKFADAVDTLEVDSMAARARAEAMRARGQAYFATWQEHLTVVKDERVRQLALKHRDELDVRFEKLRATAQQLRETFRTFLTDLKELRDSLESQPTAAHVAAESARIAQTKARGQQVQESLQTLMAELEATAALVTPSVNTAKRP